MGEGGEVVLDKPTDMEEETRLENGAGTVREVDLDFPREKSTWTFLESSAWCSL